jgi:hypothetical protein
MLSTMITLKKYAFREDAELARHQLEAAGVHARLTGENGNALFGSITGGGYCIEVEAADKQQASAVIEALEQPDDISDDELEALAMAAPGTEKEVEPSDFEPEQAADPATVHRVWRGLCWGAGVGLVINLFSILSATDPVASLAGLTWRLPAFGFFGALLAGMVKPGNTRYPDGK